MKKLLLALAAGMLLVVSVGCAYTGAVADTQGKIYLTKSSMMGLTSAYFICEPSGGNVNCKEVALEGAGGAAPAEGGEAAPAAEAAEEAGGEAEEAAAEESTEEEATE